MSDWNPRASLDLLMLEEKDRYKKVIAVIARINRIVVMTMMIDWIGIASPMVTCGCPIFRTQMCPPACRLLRSILAICRLPIFAQRYTDSKDSESKRLNVVKTTINHPMTGNGLCIPPIRMVMTEGWFIIQPHDSNLGLVSWNTCQSQ